MELKPLHSQVKISLYIVLDNHTPTTRAQFSTNHGSVKPVLGVESFTVK